MRMNKCIAAVVSVAFQCNLVLLHVLTFLYKKNSKEWADDDEMNDKKVKDLHTTSKTHLKMVA